MKDHTRYLIIGSDIFSLAAFDRLTKLHGEEEVALLCNISITKASMALKGPGLLRGDANISYIRKYNPEFLQDSDLIDSVFYKNKDFRSFNGNSRSERILPPEHFFIGSRVDVDMNGFPASENKDVFLSLVESRQIKQMPLKIERYIAEDSQEDINLRVIHTGGSITCQHLIWGYSPSAFIKLCSDKRIFGGQGVKNHFSEQEVHALYVKFKLKEKVSDRKETLFIPLSHTHEWGHFIGEFQNEEVGQGIELVTFLDKDQANEEEIIKKIKILKRGLEKIYPGFKKLIQKEAISLDEISLNFSDNLFAQISSLDYMDFVGQTAPMGLADQNLSHLARGLKSLHLIEEGLSV